MVYPAQYSPRADRRRLHLRKHSSNSARLLHKHLRRPVVERNHYCHYTVHIHRVRKSGARIRHHSRSPGLPDLVVAGRALIRPLRYTSDTHRMQHNSERCVGFYRSHQKCSRYVHTFGNTPGHQGRLLGCLGCRLGHWVGSPSVQWGHIHRCNDCSRNETRPYTLGSINTPHSGHSLSHKSVRPG